LTVSTATAVWPRRKYQRALDQKIDQRRHDEEGEPAGQCHQPEGIRITREHKADEREQRERARQRHLIDGGKGAPMPRRHQLGGDREWREDRKAAREAGQETHDDQLLARLDQRQHQGEKG
jgi:hypothetical protein